MNDRIGIKIIRVSRRLLYRAILHFNGTRIAEDRVEEFESPTPAECLGHVMFWLSCMYTLEQGIKLNITLEE